MSKHKWAKEIKAWANGAEIEMLETDVKNPEWIPFGGIWYDSIYVEYRIKPQPKEPQYLYIYGKGMGIELTLGQLEDRTLIGKIKLEQDDE